MKYKNNAIKIEPPLILTVKSKKELNDIGISSGALLISGNHYDKQFAFYSFEYDEGGVGTRNGTYWNGLYLREKSLRIPIQCIADFNAETHPEYFI